jgi:hypothetical protein
MLFNKITEHLLILLIHDKMVKSGRCPVHFSQVFDRHQVPCVGSKCEAIDQRRAQLYNVRRFRRATTFTWLWNIFEALVSELTRSLFVLIDRIEDCDAESDSDGSDCADLSSQLLPYLMGLVSETEHVSVIVTSTYEPPEAFIGELELRHFYLDTQKSRRKREG